MALASRISMQDLWPRMLALAVLPLLAHCATVPHDSAASSAQRNPELAAVLERRGDADSLAAAALLQFPVHRDQALRMFEQAVHAAPESPDLLWMLIQACTGEPDCDPQPLELRLRALDPANGVGWLGALARAYRSGDARALDAALEAVGRSGRVDLYWTTLLARLARATASTGVVPLANAEVSVMGMLSAIAIPSYLPVSSACRGEALQQEGRLQRCRSVADTLQNGDTVITEMLGAGIAERVWPGDSSQGKRAAYARKTWRFRSAQLSRVPPRTTAQANTFLALCAGNRREQDVLRAQIIARGKSLDPPAD